MSTTYKYCFCFRRRFRVSSAEPPANVKEVFERFAVNGVMGVDEIQRFLVEFQGEEKATREEGQVIIDRFRHLNIFPRRGLRFEAFFRYLFGDDNLPLSPSLGVHHDMTSPLSHYYIYTGHNSYLTGNQLNSACSDVPIIKALKRGVRVIELDMWPNATKDDVQIVHGRTLTTPVEPIKCLRSIKEHAFSASPYPVVVTLEDHLTPDLQAKVAEMISQTFGEMLFYPEQEDHMKALPSPEQLKNRIIISTKPPKEYLESNSYPEKENEAQKRKAEGDEDVWGKEVKDLNAPTLADDKSELFRGESYKDEDYPDDGDHKLQQPPAPQYRRLIAIHAGKPKGEVKDMLMVEPNKVGRLSLSEQELVRVAESDGPALVRFTQRNLLRVYPKGSRVGSSNYNPMIGWMHGAQMVAFNMQGYGRALWLMQGMFRANGGCGYVKKPDFLLKSGPHDEIFDPKRPLPVKKTLKVRVYMGDGWRLDFHRTHFDTYSPPDFYTRVGIAGLPADTIMKKTRTIEDNWTPVWDEEFTFTLTGPEIALLRIEVHEYDMAEKDDFAGQTCLPVSELRTGIRAVPLLDKKGEKLKSVKLLINFEFV